MAARGRAGQHRWWHPVAELAAAGALALGILWAFYGFRYSAARGMAHTVDLRTFLQVVGTEGSRHFVMAAPLEWVIGSGLFPESYLMGLADIVGSSGRSTRVLGTMYAEGQWFFFPVAFSVKSSIGLLVLLPVGLVALSRDATRRRQLLFLVFPAAVYFLVAAFSKYTTNIRHILQVYPYCIVLAGYGLVYLWARRPAGRWLAIGLLAYQGFTAQRTAPDYIPFANAFWGGPDRVDRVLPFDNIDWGQAARRVDDYVAAHAIRDCWQAGLVRPEHPASTIRCRQLPEGRLWKADAVPMAPLPRVLEGPVFVAARVRSTRESDTYQGLAGKPYRVVAGGAVRMYEGRHDLPGVAALAKAMTADGMRREGRLQEAISMALEAIRLAPEDPRTWISYGDALLANGQPDEAKAALEKARSLPVVPGDGSVGGPRLARLAARLDAAPR